jgi:hypothetical protein
MNGGWMTKDEIPWREPSVDPLTVDDDEHALAETLRVAIAHEHALAVRERRLTVENERLREDVARMSRSQGQGQAQQNNKRHTNETKQETPTQHPTPTVTTNTNTKGKDNGQGQGQRTRTSS